MNDDGQEGEVLDFDDQGIERKAVCHIPNKGQFRWLKEAYKALD